MEPGPETAAEGAIGELNHLYCSMDGGKPDPSWRSENEGPLLHDFTHYFDLIDLFAGEVDWLCGLAEQRRRPWAVEDFAAAFMKFKSGVTGALHGAELTEYTDNAFELRGTTGIIRMVNEQVILLQSHRDVYEPDSGFQWSSLRPTAIERPTPASSYVIALGELVQALEGTGSLRSNGIVGRRSMEMVEAVYRSQLAGYQPLRFPLSAGEDVSGVKALRRTGIFAEREGTKKK